MLDKDKDENRNSQWTKYYYPGGDIIFNNYGIKNYEKLKEQEATISFRNLVELQKKPINPNFNKYHLNEINKYLFEEIYPFAGKYRDVNMPERYGDFLEIRGPQDIGRYLDEIFEKIEKELMVVSNKEEFAELLSNLYKKLMECHPFREGNGRTIREFIREYSIVKSEELGIGNLELDWSKIDKENLNDGNSIKAFEDALISYEGIKNK